MNSIDIDVFEAACILVSMKHNSYYSGQPPNQEIPRNQEPRKPTNQEIRPKSVEDQDVKLLLEMRHEIAIFQRKIDAKQKHLLNLEQKLRVLKLRRKLKLKPYSELVEIGANGTLVKAGILRKMRWRSYGKVTRDLLDAVFGPDVLAISSLTGKTSNAHPGMAPKQALDRDKVEDIIEMVRKHSDRSVQRTNINQNITTKCADEAKRLRNELQRLYV